MSKVDFYNGEHPPGVGQHQPLLLHLEQRGLRRLHADAKATDNGGATGTSSGVNITVSSSGGSCGSASGGPTDNPVNTKYGSGTYSWTDSIKWSCVYNVNDYSGTADQKFASARDAANANGGGVVYFPAGTYTFTDTIYLKNGVVVRGATPSQTDAKQTGYAPPSTAAVPQLQLQQLRQRHGQHHRVQEDLHHHRQHG